jgi:hypothetical protein
VRNFSGRKAGQTPRHRVCALALFDRILLDQLDHLAIDTVHGDPQMGRSMSASSIST